MFAIDFIDSKRYYWCMTLNEYLQKEFKSASELARDLRVPPSMVYQYRKGIRSVPIKRCLEIERVTDGLVSRKDLRPNDWYEIWPELAVNESSQPHSQTHLESNSTPTD